MYNGWKVDVHGWASFIFMLTMMLGMSSMTCMSISQSSINEITLDSIISVSVNVDFFDGLGGSTFFNTSI